MDGTSHDELFIGVDIGTTAVKAGLFDIDGQVLDSWSRAYPTNRSRGSLVEQDPQHWLDGVFEATAALVKRRDPKSVRAVGICSQVNTHVFVDAGGLPLAPAIVWQDTRAAAEATALDETITHGQRQAWWGAPVPIDASHALARMRWMLNNRPHVWERTRFVLSPKDYCILRLAGAPVADPVASVGLVDLSLKYLDELIGLVPGASERLPPLKPFQAVVGEIQLGSTGVMAPVVTGTMDAWASLFGAGVCASGKGMYMSGTSEILALVGSTRIGSPGVITFPTIDGIVVNAGPTQSGGDSVRWWAEATRQQPQDVFAAAANANADEEAILFLPHLQGERAPLWDSQLRGGFIGLSSRTGPGELALAVLEGVALSARLLLTALEVAAGFRPKCLFYGGGGSKSDLWSQIRADCLGVPMHRLAVPNCGCLGAAILAAVGTGAFASTTDAVSSMTRIERVFDPNPRRADRYDRMSDAYLSATRALRDLTLAQSTRA